METVSPPNSRQMYNGQFCQRLSAFRKRAGYKTQADFAADLEIPAATYSKYEERTPLPHYLVAEACDLLDCGAYELFSGLSESLAPPRKPEGVARPCHIGCSLFSLLQAGQADRCLCCDCGYSQPCPKSLPVVQDDP